MLLRVHSTHTRLVISSSECTVDESQIEEPQHPIRVIKRDEVEYAAEAIPARSRARLTSKSYGRGALTPHPVRRKRDNREYTAAVHNVSLNTQQTLPKGPVPG